MICFTSWNDRLRGEFEAIEEDYSVIESMGSENIDFINEEYFRDKGRGHSVAYWKIQCNKQLYADKPPSEMLMEIAAEAQQTLFARRKLALLNDFKEIAEQMYWEDEVYEMESIDLDA